MEILPTWCLTLNTVTATLSVSYQNFLYGFILMYIMGLVRQVYQQVLRYFEKMYVELPLKIQINYMHVIVDVFCRVSD